MIRVHNGVRTRFWKDKWIGTRSLQELFPDLFDLAQDQHNTVAEMWTQQGWDMRFRRGMNDWEIPRVVELFKQLESFQGMQEGVDCLWWNGHPKGLYKVSSGYKLLHQIEPMNTFWPWKQIWKIRISYKVACFTWLLTKESVLTRENLIRRKISLCSRCFLCEKEVETVNHLFLHSSITDQLWKIFINLRGIAWVMPSKIVDTL
uniref:Reverse transcriptase zinc-binding domain-containing protein n=1 Tax=Solanum tuberosum TaxID=4113 RepID=M1AL70_SOLTU